jgi:hypothetical protein
VVISAPKHTKAHIRDTIADPAIDGFRSTLKAGRRENRYVLILGKKKFIESSENAEIENGLPKTCPSRMSEKSSIHAEDKKSRDLESICMQSMLLIQKEKVERSLCLSKICKCPIRRCQGNFLQGRFLSGQFIPVQR